MCIPSPELGATKGLASLLNPLFLATLAQIDKGVINGNDIVGAALAIADVAEMHMGGTSGALYSCAYSRLILTRASLTERVSGSFSLL